MNPRGGTEILWSAFQKYVDKSVRDNCNIICSNTSIELLKNDRPNILWQHVDTNQQAARGIGDPLYISKLERIVFVSRWQCEKYISEYSLPPEKCVVFLNAIEPVEWVEKEKSTKLKLIYTSTPWRGLEVLLEAFKLLNRNDIELDVYSSTVIYGKNFMPNGYKWLFDRCRATPGVNYRGYAANKAVVKALQRAHIFAYPSIFAETSCLAAIEAGAAGCTIATTDYGALRETCGSWAEYIPLDDHLVQRYAELLSYTIDNYWSNYGISQERSKYFNDRYSWLKRKTEWEKLLGQFK